MAMMLALCACWTSAEEAPADPLKTVMGTLSLLNMSEEDYTVKIKGRIIGLRYLAEKGVYHSQQDVRSIPEDGSVVFYDSLNAMLMALEVGDITSAEAPVCVAEYLCAHNDRLMLKGIYDLSGADDFTKQVAYRLGVGYAFLTTEDKTDLRDELDAALTEMKEDGTLDALVQTYITDAVSGEPEPVEFTKTDGETVKVAITGALPPMDFVAADGTPAGFNTAILAELGKRMNKNFELVVVDSVGRATALASGQVDLVFWTNGSNGNGSGAGRTAEEYAAYKEEQK
ncbi:MAG: transporter substrate-binding domain-containing protein, partial [Oscillospiraceae bacterium]|nr:transporter substrate-binding domain-containing protein [Oscillospiraceae bacterium]